LRFSPALFGLFIFLNTSVFGAMPAGLVAMLSKHVADWGGNVTHSKMARLGSEFIIQMHVALPPSKASGFSKSLKSKSLTQELDIQATLLTQPESDATNALMGLRIHCVGNDRYVLFRFHP
jgi:glycine cleavage system regulatory protein